MTIGTRLRLVQAGFWVVGLALMTFVVWLNHAAPEVLALVVIAEWWLIWRMCCKPRRCDSAS